MGWSIGFDVNWNRDVGYGVPAECDHPDCDEQIDRGLSYVCGNDMYGGEFGCGLYFCGKHRSDFIFETPVCERCAKSEPAFEPKPDVEEWVNHKETHHSWAKWREERDKKNETTNR